MLGLLPLAGLLILSGEFRAYGTAVAELRVGQAPVQAGQAPRGGVVAAVTPIGELEYTRPDRQVICDYGPRILWREPNALTTDKPLVLHVLNLSVTVDTTPTLRLIERGSVSYGEADYVALSQIFASQGTLPQILNIFAVTAGTGLRWDASRRWRVETIFDVEHRAIVGDTTTTPTTTTPVAMPPAPATTMGGIAAPINNLNSFQQTNLSLDSSGIARVTRRQDLVLTAGVSERDLHNGVDLFAVTPEVGWRARLARTTELRLAAGFTYVRDLGTHHVVSSAGIVRPVGNVELNGLLLGRQGVAWRGTAGVTLDYFVDPFLGAAGPRVVTIARSQVLFEPSWTVGVEGTFATSLRATPPPLVTGPAPDETVATAALPVRHRISASLVAELGLRWSMYAPRIRADDFAFRERQTWIYVSLTGSTRRIDEWVAVRDQSADARDEGAFARPQTTDATRQSADVVQQADGAGIPARAATAGPPAGAETDAAPASTPETGGVEPANTGP